MPKKKFIPYDISELHVSNAGSEGKCIARYNEKVYMLDHAVPGDVVNARVVAEKRHFGTAKINSIITPSPDRVEPFCEHFGTCGGCKWQQMTYTAQLNYKTQQVKDAFDRIGKLTYPAIQPAIGSARQQFYRNKLEYSFTHRKWLTHMHEKDSLSEAEHAGLGFHIPARFDKVFDVKKCWLMDDLQNDIRNSIKHFCVENHYTFFDLYKQEGFMRNMIIRLTATGEWMLIVCFGYDDAEKRDALMNYIHQRFPQITSLLYVINTKRNDKIDDLPVHVYAGKDHITEWLGELQFNIGPVSFFQTNTEQTITLYTKALELASLSGSERVYDLYTGVGTIALFMARKAKHVVGVEYVQKAIDDARSNAALNGITNCSFFAGDMKNVLTADYVEEQGKPDVIITDPPRAGMHEDVIARIVETAPSRVVYISCNAATQARDIALMESAYAVTHVQPVDMFPHTHHIENIALLEKK
ncbi:MAG: 23S rRNA (uracil(1939)-C(5))-methyltransferase RlmD [Bacteroidota bacterium]